jgi:hypothetical protein
MPGHQPSAAKNLAEDEHVFAIKPVTTHFGGGSGTELRLRLRTIRSSAYMMRIHKDPKLLATFNLILPAVESAKSYARTNPKFLDTPLVIRVETTISERTVRVLLDENGLLGARVEYEELPLEEQPAVERIAERKLETWASDARESDNIRRTEEQILTYFETTFDEDTALQQISGVNVALMVGKRRADGIETRAVNMRSNPGKKLELAWLDFRTEFRIPDNSHQVAA